MHNDGLSGCIVFFIILLLVFFLGLSMRLDTGKYNTRELAKRGIVEYDKETGELDWAEKYKIEKKEKTNEDS